MDEYEGVIPEPDLREMYSVREWYVAEWRERVFGLPLSPLVNEAVMRHLGDRYLNGLANNPYFPAWREALPPGSDASWIRGTWAPVPVTWLDRAQDLSIECDAVAEARRR